MKLARILEYEDGNFGLEYDDTRGTKNSMRLDAASYEAAIIEAKAFLEIDRTNRDTAGEEWEIE